ncbi:MAG: hypothetical protein AB7H97_09350 [Pseudobdellovibrionaceae bacterium]
MYQPNGEPEKTICLALEAGIYANPESPDLTFKEIFEICERRGFQKGQTNDAINQSFNRNGIEQKFGEDKINLPDSYLPFTMWWESFKSERLRDLRIIDFILKSFDREVKVMGKREAAISTDSLEVEAIESLKCTQKQFRTNLLLAKKYKLINFDGGIIKCPTQREFDAAAIERSFGNQSNKSYRRDEEQLLEILEIVKDIFARRNETLTVSIDPYNGFAELLTKFDAKNFATWWRLNMTELHRLDPVRHSTSKMLLSAAMCEAALLLTLNKIKVSGKYPSLKMDEDPQRWKLSDLAKAASIVDIRIIDDRVRDQLLKLNEDRRRIHAGAHVKKDGVISPVPDINPEQARHSTELLEVILRKIIEWTQNRQI